MVDIGPYLNISWLIFLHPIPLRAPELVLYACFGLIHHPHTESTRSETPRQLSQHRVRLHINWVNTEWDSTPTESTQKAPTFMKISSFRVGSVDMESHSPLTQSIWSLTWRWLIWRGMRLSHCRMLKNLNKSGNSSTKSKTLKSLIIWPIYVWLLQKKQKKNLMQVYL
jgi:hypothetical protein